MKTMRFADLTQDEVLDLTSLTTEEFEYLVPRFEQEYRFYMTEWRFDGKMRTRRSHSTYRNCPLPTPEDRLLFVLTYLKSNVVQSLHGKLFGLPLGKTNMWIHTLLPILGKTLRNLGLAPSRRSEELWERLEIKTNPPFFATTAPNDPSNDPKIQRSRGASTAERKSATP